MSGLLAAIRETLKSDHVTFAELARLDGFAGDYQWTAAGNPNVIIWANMSEAATDALRTILYEEEKYELHPTSLLTYLIDGMTLSLPLVKSKYAYKKPHWLPCVIRERRP